MSGSTASPGSPAPAAETAEPHHPVGTAAGVGLVLAALGVVFGDIGTSPLYALNTVLEVTGGAHSGPAAILGRWWRSSRLLCGPKPARL